MLICPSFVSRCSNIIWGLYAIVNLLILQKKNRAAEKRRLEDEKAAAEKADAIHRNSPTNVPPEEAKMEAERLQRKNSRDRDLESGVVNLDDERFDDPKDDAESDAVENNNDSVVAVAETEPPIATLESTPKSDTDLESGLKQSIDVKDETKEAEVEAVAPVSELAAPNEDGFEERRRPRWALPLVVCIMIVLIIAIALGVSLGGGGGDDSNKSSDIDQSKDTDLIVPNIPSMHPSSSSVEDTSSLPPTLTMQPSSQPSAGVSQAVTSEPTEVLEAPVTSKPTTSPSNTPVTVEPTNSPSAKPLLTESPTATPLLTVSPTITSTEDAPGTTSSPPTVATNETPTPSTTGDQTSSVNPTASMNQEPQDTNSPTVAIQNAPSNTPTTVSPTPSPSYSPTVDCTSFTRKKACLRPRKHTCSWDLETQTCSDAELL